MSFLKRFVLGFFIVLLAHVAYAKPLRVGVLMESKPFSWQTSDGKYRGAAVDLFRHIAKDLDWEYEFTLTGPSFNKAVDAVHDGKFDILIGPVSVSYARYQKVDFSRPFFLNNLGVAVKQPDESNTFMMLARELGKKLGYLLPILFGAFLLVSFIFYFMDNKKHSLKPQEFFPRFGHAMWESVMILIQGSLLEDSSRTLKRVIILIWLVPSIVLFSIVVGTIASTITVLEQNKSNALYLKKDVLSGKKLAAIEGSITIAEGEKAGAIMIPVKSRLESLRLVDRGTAFGATGDFLTLQEAIKKNPDLQLKMSTINLRNDELAYVFQKGSPLLRPFNKELLNLQDNDLSEAICRRTLGDKGDLCVI